MIRFREYSIRVAVFFDGTNTSVSLSRCDPYDPAPFGQLSVLGFTDHEIPYETMLTAIGRALVEGPPDREPEQHEPPLAPKD